MQTKTLTQKELLSILYKKGFTEITLRRLTDWRENNLIPKFDCVGRGLGKGKGKQKNQWSNRKLVINQAIWVFKLLEHYRNFSDLYLPLWILGYPIPLDIIREQLTTPLSFFLEDLENQAINNVTDEELLTKDFGFIEDYLSDIFHKLSKKDTFSRMFSLPDEIGEGLLNLFVNPEYLTDDLTFELEENLSSLRNYNRRLEKSFLTAFELENENVEISEISKNENSIEFILKNADFVHTHFSVSQFLSSMENISDEELQQVQLDMVILCKIINELNEGIKILFKDTPVMLDDDQLKGLLQMIFSTGKLIIWGDVSLRDKGYSTLINQIRFDGLKKFEETFKSEETKIALKEANSLYANAFEKMLDTLEKGLNNMLKENKLFLQGNLS